MSAAYPDFLLGDSGDVTDPWRRLKRAAGEVAFAVMDLAAGRAAAVAARLPLPAARRAGGRRLPVWLAAGGGAARRPLGAPPSHVSRSARPPAPIRAPADTAAERLVGGKFENLNQVIAGDADADRTLDGRRRRAPAALASSIGWSASARRSGSTSLSRRRRCSATRPGSSRGGGLLSLARETRFVEIGPVTALPQTGGRATAAVPGAALRLGLDLHWAALAAERGRRLGVVDALPFCHQRVHGRLRLPARGSRARGGWLPRRPALPARRRAGDVLAVHCRVGR